MTIEERLERLEQQTPQQQTIVQMPPRAACSRGIYIVLGIFLGGLGIHNFIIGRFGPAIAQLLITVLLGWLILPLLFVGIWVIVELFTVTRDSKGVLM